MSKSYDSILAELFREDILVSSITSDLLEDAENVVQRLSKGGPERLQSRRKQLILLDWLNDQENLSSSVVNYFQACFFNLKLHAARDLIECAVPDLYEVTCVLRQILKDDSCHNVGANYLMTRILVDGGQPHRDISKALKYATRAHESLYQFSQEYPLGPRRDWGRENGFFRGREGIKMDKLWCQLLPMRLVHNFVQNGFFDTHNVLRRSNYRQSHSAFNFDIPQHSEGGVHFRHYRASDRGTYIPFSNTTTRSIESNNLSELTVVDEEEESQFSPVSY
jgi:hypothetical protein